VLTGEQPQWRKIALTYAVPFCVSSYGVYCAASVRGQRLRHNAAGRRLSVARDLLGIGSLPLAPDQFATAPGNPAH
jgi:hypothetical protein